MQLYFNNLQPIDNNTTPGECAMLQKITLSPNPTSGLVNLEGTIENCLFLAKIRIHNTNSQLLLEAKLVGDSLPTIDLSAFVPGIYFMSIETWNHLEIKKLVKD